MTLATEIEVINVALDHIGEEAIIDTNDDRKAARIGTRQYDVARRALLRSYNWNFARQRASLGPESTAPLFGFQSKFRLPADCVRFVGFYDQAEPQNNYTSTTVPHRIEGGFLLADGAEAPIFYIADVTNVSQFDPCFVDMLAWDLAGRISLGLSGGAEIPKTLRDGFALARANARIANAFEGTPEVIVASEWVDAMDAGFRPTRIGPIV